MDAPTLNVTRRRIPCCSFGALRCRASASRAQLQPPSAPVSAAQRPGRQAASRTPAAACTCTTAIETRVDIRLLATLPRWLILMKFTPVSNVDSTLGAARTHMSTFHIYQHATACTGDAMLRDTWRTHTNAAVYNATRASGHTGHRARTT